MLSPKVHIMLGTVEVNKVERWAQKQTRFMEAISKQSFQKQVEQAYQQLIELANKKGFSKWEFEDLHNTEKFMALITQNMATKFAEEVSKEPFLEKSHEDVENETVSSADWITEQIVRTQKIIREKIEIKFIEKARIEYRKSHSKEKSYEYNYCECYD